MSCKLESDRLHRFAQRLTQCTTKPRRLAAARVGRLVELVERQRGQNDFKNRSASTGTTSFVSDKRSAVTLQTTPAGFRSFGCQTTQISPNSNFAFVGWQGSYQDAEFNLYLTGARYYNPETGRFTSPDPKGLDAGDTNLYRYCGNNPTNGTDPSGMLAAEPEAVRRTHEFPAGELLWKLITLQKEKVAGFFARFTPREKCPTCKKIVFVQIVKSVLVKDGKETVLYPGTREELKNPEWKKYWDQFLTKDLWRVDIRKDAKWPFPHVVKNAQNDWEGEFKDPNETIHQNEVGNKPKDGKGVPARFTDESAPGPMSWAGQGDIKKSFETYAVCIETGEVHGGISWGYSLADKEGSELLFTGGTENDLITKPSQHLLDALAKWNALAKQNAASGWIEFQVPNK